MCFLYFILQSNKNLITSKEAVCLCVQQDDPWHAKVSDVRSQLRFLEEMERLKKRRKDEEERETLLRLARVRRRNRQGYQADI